MDPLLLLPQPQSLALAEGQYVLHPGGHIVLEGGPPAELLAAGRRVQAALHDHAALAWDLVVGAFGPPAANGTRIVIVLSGYSARAGNTAKAANAIVNRRFIKGLAGS